MDSTNLVKNVAHLFELTGHKVQTSVRINHREIDVVAEELNGLLRKTILIECADYSDPVGVDKLQMDLRKLRAAQELMGDRAVVMHVSRVGYSPDASGYARDQGIAISTINALMTQMVNFDPYVEAVQNEPIKKIILAEYQPSRIHFDGHPQESTPALQFLGYWLDESEPWLTLLGDYGVGKSWTLKRFLYKLMDAYVANPTSSPLPLFIPLQRFPKAFDFENLVLRTFQLYGLTGIHYGAFQFLARNGRVVFLLDSFDEMAQVLSRDILRENLRELLTGAQGCRVIMTSRPTYFESRAERMVVVDSGGVSEWHSIDEKEFERHTAISRAITDRLREAQFARLNDLSPDQRKKLFAIVLGQNPVALKRLAELYVRFQELETISQRAVIARLLTTVAETLATGTEVRTVEGYPLIPDELKQLNQAKIFEIVVYNLLQRDSHVGFLSASERLSFLRQFAVFLQRADTDFFADPTSLRQLVERIFAHQLARTDTPQQLLENYTRICRRHSGLTTEAQFLDTSGNIDSPVDEQDTDSRVGFSHNSLREYLAADALADFIKNGTDNPDFIDMVVTDVIGDFIVDMAQYQPDLPDRLSAAYRSSVHPRMRDRLFRVIYRFIHRDPAILPKLLGSPGEFHAVDLTAYDLSSIDLRQARFTSCALFDTDLRKSDLRQADFNGSIIYRVLLDGASVASADFRSAEVDSIYVFDQFDTRTLGIYSGKAARQWLFSNGALVFPNDDLNPLLGRPWYEAAREVMRTIEKRIAGTHQDISLSKGTQSEHRGFARDFVDFLVSKNVLYRVKKSNTGPGWVVKVHREHRTMISEFVRNGLISPILASFFERYLKK